MKRITILLIALVLTTTVSAQKEKGKKDMAKKVTTEMTEVLSLDDATSTKVYTIQSEKFTAIKASNKELKDDKEALKAKKKALNKAAAEKLKTLLGKGEMQKWSAHVKAKKSKSKKK